MNSSCPISLGQRAGTAASPRHIVPPWVPRIGFLATLVVTLPVVSAAETTAPTRPISAASGLGCLTVLLILLALLSLWNRALHRQVVRGITDRKRDECEREISRELLRLRNCTGSLHALAERATGIMHDWSDCEAVGLRLQEGDDFPYFETRGFPATFVTAESHLCAHKANGDACRDSAGDPILECMCGCILQGRFDPGLPCFTPSGSFWTNSTTQLLATPGVADQLTLTRNRCINVGYESMALVPIRHAGETFGLLQFNDKRANRFDPARIALFERLAGNLAIELLHHRTSAALRQQEAQYRLLVENQSDLIVHLDLSYRIRFVSQSCCRAYEKEADAFLGQNFFSLAHAEDRQMARRSLSPVLVAPYEAHYQARATPPRGCRWFAWRATAIRNDDSVTSIMCIGRDITDQMAATKLAQKMSVKLAEANRRESLGVLAGGVAHDLNNILGPIILLPEMVDDVLQNARDASDEQIAEAREDLAVIADSARRGAATIADLKSLRHQQVSRSPLDLGELVRKSLMTPDFATLKTRHSNVHVDVIAPSGVVMRGERHGIERVLLNLITNAMEAMSAPGCVQVEAESIALTEPKLAYEVIASGRYTVLHVRNTGLPISDSLCPRIFEPFVSDKQGTADHSGSGLGLSVVHAIVKDHGGYVDLTRGNAPWTTTVSLYFPDTGTIPIESIPQTKRGTCERGTERILVVDDEPAQRFTARRRLESLGYHVTEAAHGHAALALFDSLVRDTDTEATPLFDLVLLDMIMEDGFDGLTTLHEIRRRRPAQKAIICSGHASPDQRQAAIDLGVPWLGKPYESSDIAHVVRACLDASPAAVAPES